MGEHACEECLAGKMAESFHKTTDSRSDQLGYRLHCDLSGIKVPSIRGYRYFLLVVDDATRMDCMKLLKSKETREVFPALQETIAEIETYLSQKPEHLSKGHKPQVVAIRADNGRGEFGQTFQDHLRIKGKKFEPSPEYTNSLNGVVERLMRVINGGSCPWHISRNNQIYGGATASNTRYGFAIDPRQVPSYLFKL